MRATLWGAAPFLLLIARRLSLDDARTHLLPSRDLPAARARSDARAELRRANWRGIDTGNVMSVELISAILGWAGIGWLVDRWLGTPPWFLVIGGLVGNFAGLYLVYLRGQRMNAQDELLRDEAAGRRPAAPLGGSQ